MKRLSVMLIVMLWLLCACAGEGESPEPQPSVPEEPIRMEQIMLECSAPANSGGDFPAAAKAFGAALQEALAAEDVEVETLRVSFSRMDAATVDALENGGITLGLMGLGGALADEGAVLLGLSRGEDELSCGLVMAGESDYGNQLAWRTKTAPLTAEEWRRAKIGAVGSDRVLLAAAQQLLYESADYILEEYIAYATAEELLAAAQRGEVDAAIIRGEDVEEFWALTENILLHEGVVVLSAAAEQLQSEQAHEKLIRAIMAAAETDAGRELLVQYGCGGFAKMNEEEIGGMRSLAIWEEMK